MSGGNLPYSMDTNDWLFFRMNPQRNYWARSYTAGEFGAGDLEEFSQVNTVIARRFGEARKRLPFNVPPHVSLDNDTKIICFLLSRGIDPETMIQR